MNPAPPVTRYFSVVLILLQDALKLVDLEGSKLDISRPKSKNSGADVCFMLVP
jgi:hypothetical protein